ncbi:MAG: hypothetical protein DIU78_017295 [Pseudomonadota bacterium]
MSRQPTALFLGTAFAIAQFSGCGTDAVGIEACRRIERARCDAAVSCGFVDDGDACKRFYRDHCLHGLGRPAPDATSLDRCVQTIERASACARSNPEATAGECADPPSSADLDVCALVRSPERAPECAFLSVAPVPMPPSGGAGASGEAGTDSATAGAGGSAEP